MSCNVPAPHGFNKSNRIAIERNHNIKRNFCKKYYVPVVSYNRNIQQSKLHRQHACQEKNLFLQLVFLKVCEKLFFSDRLKNFIVATTRLLQRLL